MLSTMVRLWRIFSRKFCKKKPYSIPLHITLNNLIPVDEREYLKGSISLGHCRGRNWSYHQLRFMENDFGSRSLGKRKINSVMDAVAEKLAKTLNLTKSDVDNTVIVGNENDAK